MLLQTLPSCVRRSLYAISPQQQPRLLPNIPIPPLLTPFPIQVSADLNLDSALALSFRVIIVLHTNLIFRWPPVRVSDRIGIGIEIPFASQEAVALTALNGLLGARRGFTDYAVAVRAFLGRAMEDPRPQLPSIDQEEVEVSEPGVVDQETYPC
jgi:hypothetical protein